MKCSCGKRATRKLTFPDEGFLLCCENDECKKDLVRVSRERNFKMKEVKIEKKIESTQFKLHINGFIRLFYRKNGG